MSKIQCVNIKIDEYCFDLYCADVPDKELRRVSRLVEHCIEMHSMLLDAMNALRCAGVGDTRYALPKAHDIEILLNRIDGKEAGA